VLLLALDTATPSVTVALHDGSRVLAGQDEVTARKHGELLAAMIERVLAAAGAARTDLEAIAVGTGPGPYTGLRAGLVTAKVLASALDRPVVGICSLDVIAREAAAGAAGREFMVATDARRKEVYWARYGSAGDRISGPAVAAPAEVAWDASPVAGEGGYLYPELASCTIPPRYPDAARLAEIAAARLASHMPLEPAEPLYLRRPDARVPGKPKRVTPC
jgi:tRNA threonylcarbamoyl adenosine modification protein YeaZ